MTLVNEAHGTIEADVAGGTLTLDTGAVINNDGVLEAINGGTLHIDDSVHGGSAVISGGTLEFGAASDVAVQFDNGTGHTPSYGELVLDDAKDFSGQISGFAGTAPDAAHSDTVDLAGFVESSYSVQTVGNNEVLTLHDSSGDVVTLTFDNFSATLDVASDGEGGTLITDPPAANSSGGSASAPTAKRRCRHRLRPIRSDGVQAAVPHPLRRRLSGVPHPLRRRFRLASLDDLIPEWSRMSAKTNSISVLARRRITPAV